MALFYPDRETIKRFKVPPTEGEMTLLSFLEKVLDDSYEVYFNPFLNGDRPDVIIMRKNGGVMIIEVKDWDLDLYQLNEKKHWQLKHPKNEGESNAIIKSPIDQVCKYKENLYELHVESLLEMNIKNPKLWGVVVCGVYFHKATHQQINNLLVVPFKEEKGYQKFIKNIVLLGHDNLNSVYFKDILNKKYMGTERNSSLFTDSLYYSIRRELQPPLHLRNQGKEILRYNGHLKRQLKNKATMMYTRKQDVLIFDEMHHRKTWRVKGVAGSGKTTVLAAKAVQCYKELTNIGIKNPKILILTYNITLKNYIHDKINDVAEDFNWKSFTILNYHQFINAQLNNLNISFERIEDESIDDFFSRYYDNYDLFADRASKTERFDVIFIDEIQDYKRVWMDIIKDLFLIKIKDYYKTEASDNNANLELNNPQGGYYLFGDVKQNIYSRETSNKDVVTNVLGATHKLDTCFRADMKVRDLALGFQQTYFSNKYEIDTISHENEEDGEDENNNLTLFSKQDLQQGYLNYINLENGNHIETIFNIINGNLENKVNSISLNDITILGAEIKFLQLFDAYYRYKTGHKTSTMFETYEIMFLEGLKDKNDTFDYEFKEFKSKLEKLFDNGIKSSNNKLANLFAIYELHSKHNEVFEIRMNRLCANYKININDFKTIMSNHQEEYSHFRNYVFNKDFKYIRDNKKFNFWQNTGNIKISSIHSFKGWECDTIFLILQNRTDNETSFEELLYTGITRTQSNLIIINLGNKEYHENMKRLIDSYK